MEIGSFGVVSKTLVVKLFFLNKALRLCSGQAFPRNEGDCAEFIVKNDYL
jgi:hypothetical protein